jgi:hypothetical protein
MVLVAGQVLPNVLHDLVQLLGPSQRRFMEASSIFAIDVISLRRANRLHGEHRPPGHPV